MTAKANWASPEDFATLFQYFWHRDFPQAPKAQGARRIDWTIHIGIIVRNIADLMGLYTRFEYGKRTDAVFRTVYKDLVAKDLVALEWEWDGVWGNEIDKLKQYKPRGSESLKYCVLITYTHTPNIEKVYDHVLQKWKGARWPLLLILVDFEDSKKYASGRIFNKINISLLNGDTREELKISPALPWKIEKTRWFGRET